MTVKELKDALILVDEHKEIRIRINDIIDNFGFLINTQSFPTDTVETEFYFDICGYSND